MTTNIATTREQSARLLQCGADPKTADMSWVRGAANVSDGDLSLHPYLRMQRINWQSMRGRNKIAPAWSLSALLRLLPKEIRHNGCTYKLNIDYPPIGMVAARYNTEDDDLDSLNGCLCKELIDALYSLLVWCLEKGYVKLD